MKHVWDQISQINAPIKKVYGKDYAAGWGADMCHHHALTLSPGDLGTNESGWTISGSVCEDYYEWVNYFEAVHPIYGRVWGDFEDTVLADSEEGFQHFYKHHTPTSWDYWDI